MSLEPILIDVRPIPKPQRHPLIFDALEQLPVGGSLVVKNDHNPVPLRGQVEAIYASQFTWNYLEEGPEVFRLQFTRQNAAPDGWNRRDFQNSLPIAPEPVEKGVVTADLCELLRAATISGPQWGHETDDLDMTFLSWEKGKRIEPHVNAEVDVLWIGIEGSGVAIIDGQNHELRPGVVLVIPKGSERGVESTSERLSYLSVHRRRRGLMPTFKGQELR